MHIVFSCFLLRIFLWHFFRFLRITLPPGGHPTAVAFSDDVSSIVVASQMLAGSSLYMYGEEKAKALNETKQQAKLPLPELKWERHKVHEKRAILTLVGTTASYGSADGSTIFASCSEGILLSFILEKLCFFFFLASNNLLLSRNWYHPLAWKNWEDFGKCWHKSVEKYHGRHITKRPFYCCRSFYCRCEGEDL